MTTRYDALTQRMADGSDGTPSPWSLMPWGLRSPDNWTKDLREAQAARLLEVRDLDAQAVAEIEAALQAAPAPGR